MKVIVADKISERGVELLRNAGWNIVLTTKDNLNAEIADADALVVRSATKVTPELLEKAPRLRVVGRAVRDRWLLAGIALMAVSFYAFLTMLSWYPVSFVVPATSLAYVAGALGAKFFLGEHPQAFHFLGFALVLTGVFVASRKPQAG